MPDDESTVDVEVVYALPGNAHVIALKVAANCTIREAILQSEILQACTEIDLQKNRVGIFNQLCDLKDVVKHGDRIEIYRPLVLEPKEARRRRAEKQKVNKN
jgi:uncharacterized protein